MRHGSRMAAAPPGSPTGRRCARRSQPLEVDVEELATPQRAVAPVAEAVEGDPEDALGAAVLGEARGDVRVVVLHAPQGQVGLERPLRAEVLGMQVVDDDVGRDAEQPAEVLDRLAERGVRGRVLEVAEVVTGHQLVARPRR